MSIKTKSTVKIEEKIGWKSSLVMQYFTVYHFEPFIKIIWLIFKKLLIKEDTKLKQKFGDSFQNVCIQLLKITTPLQKFCKTQTHFKIILQNKCKNFAIPLKNFVRLCKIIQ